VSPAPPRPGAAWLCRGTNAWGTGLMAMDANQLPDSVIAGIEAPPVRTLRDPRRVSASVYRST